MRGVLVDVIDGYKVYFCGWCYYIINEKDKIFFYSNKRYNAKIRKYIRRKIKKYQERIRSIRS